MINRFHIHLTDELAKRLNDYIKATYDKQYGKRRVVGEMALTNFLDYKDLGKYCETIDLSMEDAMKAINAFLDAKETP